MIYTGTGCTPQAHGSRDILLRNMHAPDPGKIKRMGFCYFEENRRGQGVEMAVGRITAVMALTRRQVGVNPECKWTNSRWLGGGWRTDRHKKPNLHRRGRHKRKASQILMRNDPTTSCRRTPPKIRSRPSRRGRTTGGRKRSCTKHVSPDRQRNAKY